MPEPDFRNMDPATRYPRALQAMRNPGFLKTPKYKEQQTRAVTVGADIRICEFADKLVRRAAGMGIPLFPLCIVRTHEDQAAEFVQGNSRDDPSDGMWPHMAYAVDIIHGTLGYMDKPKIPHAWDCIGHLGKEVANSMDLKIVWGGDWKFYDPAHWEIHGWKEHVRLGGRPMRG